MNNSNFKAFNMKRNKWPRYRAVAQQLGFMLKQKLEDEVQYSQCPAMICTKIGALENSKILNESFIFPKYLYP